MDPSKANPRESLRQAIDAEIQSLEESTRESIRALRHRRNALAPVLSLPTEVIVAIFSFLHVHATSFSIDEHPDPLDRLGWLHVTHVCHQWREIALDHPLLWSLIDFTAFSSAGTAEILARAKMAPLYLEARVPSSRWDDARFSAFKKELQGCVTHISHLTITAGPSHLSRTLKGLKSPAPALEYLSLWSKRESLTTGRTPAFVPDTLFDGTTGTPRLSCIKLWSCDFSWQSPLLRGLKHLEIRDLFVRPSLSEWLDALDEMSQLKTLTLHWACPSEPFPFDVGRTVTLPSLTVFEISSPARDCGLALAHLVLPALTSLRVISIPLRWDQDVSDAQYILPYITQHSHGLHDTQPLQSIVFRDDAMRTEILAWTLPGIDVEMPKVTDFRDTMHSARVALSFIIKDTSSEADIRIFDAVMEALPLDDLVTATSYNLFEPLNEQFWSRHAPRWSLLRRVRLSPLGVRGFVEMLLGDNGGRESPLLPSLKELILVNNVLRPRRMLRLYDALMKRVVPLETLDLRTCLSSSRGIESLNEIVGDVLGPDKTFETETKMLSACIARSLSIQDDPVPEGYDEDDPDTGSDAGDDVFWSIREIYDRDDSEDEED